MSRMEREAYAKAGGVAEEVISSMRTVQAFGGQEKEALRWVMIASVLFFFFFFFFFLIIVPVTK